MQDRRERRRRGIINAVATKYNVLINPELLEALIDLQRDPVDAIGDAISSMRPDEIVINVGHFEVH